MYKKAETIESEMHYYADLIDMRSPTQGTVQNSPRFYSFNSAPLCWDYKTLLLIKNQRLKVVSIKCPEYVKMCKLHERWQ